MPNRALVAKAQRAKAARTEFAMQRQYNIIAKFAASSPSKQEVRAQIVMGCEEREYLGVPITMLPPAKKPSRAPGRFNRW